MKPSRLLRGSKTTSTTNSWVEFLKDSSQFVVGLFQFVYELNNWVFTVRIVFSSTSVQVYFWINVYEFYRNKY